MRRIGGHAVVIGGSLGGLLAAKALADAYERVTVVERDALPHGLEGRRAVPQGRHAHALLPYGQECLEALLPGICDSLVADGAAACDAFGEMRFILGGHQFARPSTGQRPILAGRPFIEGHVRRAVRAVPAITVIDRCDVAGLTASSDDARVTGVRIIRRADGSAEEGLPADLVVAATGRAARIPAWLEAMGYPRPAEQRLRIDVAYASRHLRLAAGAPSGDRFVLIGARPDLPRTLFLFAQEEDRWILSLGGYGAEHRPPADLAGHLDFAATVAPPDVFEAIAAAEPLGPISTYGFPDSIRRRYDRLPRFPQGLLVTGDAVCSFNPTYGQGMTVAAAEAVALRECLAEGEHDLARRFFHMAAKPVEHAWTLSTGADLALPHVPGTRPLRVRGVNRYVRRLHAVAEHDDEVAAAFIDVVRMHAAPPTLMRPRVAARVLRGPRARWDSAPEGLRTRELAIGDVRTPLREAGPAGADDAVVFLHGNPGSGADWEPLIAAVGRDRRAVAWDAPGFGQSVAPGFPQTVETHAAFIGDVLDALGVRRAHLVVHDFGGPWGLRWAAGHPERFASAVMLCTGALPGYRWHALARLWRMRGAGELFMATTTGPGFRALLRRGNPRGLPRAFTDRMYRDLDRGTRRAVLELYRSVGDVARAGEELADALRPLDRPALVLWGRHDPYLRVAEAERQRAAFPSADVRVLDHSGHWPFVDAPAAVQAALLGHLARHAPVAAPTDVLAA